jgi:vacuolar protein sorting-associated protein 53
MELLRSRCPIPIQNMTSSSMSLGSMPSLTFSNTGNSNAGSSANASVSTLPASLTQQVIYRLQPGQELVVCHIINTGEYCVEVVPQLEQMIKAKINPNLADKVDMTKEVDGFHDLVAFAMKVLISGVLDRLEPAFKQMVTIPWGNVAAVGEESAYCHIIASMLQELIPKLQATLSSSFFNTFCTKFVSEFLARYTDVITKQKRISEMGSQQLLLDTYNLKTLFMKLPAMGSSSTTAIPSMYTKIVTSRINHIEAILKLIGTPEEVLVERFRVLWPDGGPTDLQLLMSLKVG